MSLSSPLSPPTAISDAAHRTRHAAGIAARNPWIERFARFGLIVRGVIYFVPGVIALQLALGTHGGAMTQTGAIEMIGHQPFGRALLVIVAVGLAGYSLWGVIRALFDPLHKGHSPLGLAKRFGFATSALAYASLFVATLRYLSGALGHVAKPYDWTAGLLAKPLGAWLVGIIGLCWIAGAGIAEIARGWRGSFREDLDFGRIGTTERRWAMRLGRFGIVARGVVFTIIGMLLVGAAFHANSQNAGGMDGALLALARQPFGRMLLAAAGLGLIAFGVFSAMCARWMRTRVAGPAPV
jgi:Domain of Unknown Function (DUF1206)